MNQNYVREVFEHISQRYDKANRIISLGNHKRWKEYLADTVLRRLHKGAGVLDLCCGTADMIEILTEKSPETFVVGVDFSEKMLEVAKIKLKNKKNVRLVQADVKNLPFDDESFDGVTVSFGLRNIDGYISVLKEIQRVTKKGGVIGCLDSFIPRNRLIRFFHRLYFTVAIPIIGGHMNCLSDYTWLYKSTRMFVTPEQLAESFERCGMKIVCVKAFMCASIVVHTAIKEE